MKVRFAADVLNEPGAWSVLDRIMDLFFEKRHLWDIDDADKIKNSQWIQSDPGGRTNRLNVEILETYDSKSFYHPNKSQMHTITLVVTLQGTSEYELPPDDARRCLEKPAYVAVENIGSDKAFFEAMIYVFDREELRGAHCKGWWRFENMGGFGGVERCVEYLRGQTTGPLRVFVLSDSDRLYPGQEDTNTIKKVKGYCEEHGIPYAILRKRESENYLPISAIQGGTRKFKKTRKAFLKLNQEQKDHYDMKSGFSRKKKEEDRRRGAIVPEKQKALYKHVPKPILNNLCGGFGREVWQYFESACSVITENAIRLICTVDSEEIPRILDQIEELL